jgi:hypothetical protein
MVVDVVSLEGFDERFGHAAGLRAAHRSKAWHQPQAVCKVDRFASAVTAGIVREPLHAMRKSSRSEAPLDALQHQIADHLHGDAASTGVPSHDLPITGFQREGDPDDLAVPTSDLDESDYHPRDPSGRT